MNETVKITRTPPAAPVTFGAEAFISPEYARAEADRLWPKVWQHACRVEELQNVGDYVVYDVLDDTILITRSDENTISAFYNVCAHRGRRLVDGCGQAAQFRCKYHAWAYNLKGENIRVLDKDDWGGALCQERLSLPPVKVDTWGGFVWINMDPDAIPLRDYLEPAATMLDAFELDRMRYRWRQWCYFDCNWKTAIEAFVESYHVEGTHPQLLKYADFYTWSQEQGLHGNDGFEEHAPEIDIKANNTITRTGKGADPRVSIAELQNEIYDTVNSSTTQTFVTAAERLVDELPEGTPAHEVMAHFMAAVRRDDRARGVEWPTIDHDHHAAAGLAWHVFPNMTILHGITFALIYRVRPHGFDPNKCIFEAAALERYPEGEEPKTEWVHADPDDLPKWRSVLMQDFDNMAEVQKGMRSRGFRGTLPNPRQERKVTNFHYNLAKYMETGAPKPLK
jgi:phenylpropionate dioxygenase-like ring-hydroxylating dioxygenase large terminal subunit